MKKIITTLAMAAFAMISFAQSSQQYWHVEFDMPIVSDGTGRTSVAAGMKDNYTYCNPLHQYLDFPAGGNLKANGIVGDMGFRATTTQVNENSSFYLENGRVTWTTAGNTAQAKYPFDVDHITKMTAYTLPVETVTLIDSTAAHEITFFGDNKTYKVSEFTFNRLPRNVAELKTLMEDGNGNRVQACNNPLFIAAVMYLVWPRMLDCSQDAREMIDYLYGTQYIQLQTVGISNQSFQNACISSFTSNGGRDSGGGWLHNNLFQHFAGATPANQYKPLGQDYWNADYYKVRVGWYPPQPTSYSSQMQCTIANLCLFPNPDGETKDEISFESPLAHNFGVRSTNKNGWFFQSNEKVYYSVGKDQRDTSF